MYDVYVESFFTKTENEQKNNIAVVKCEHIFLKEI